MPMTKADWNVWSLEKRKFYAELFACYLIADDGMLRIDGIRRRELVRAQLAKQEVDGAEKIIARGTSANYVIADGLQPDGQTLRGAHEADRIRVLCSQRGDIATMRSMFPIAAQDHVEEDALTILARAGEAAANREPIQHSIVGGFKRPDQATLDHFVEVVKVKMLNSMEREEPRAAQVLSLGEIDDLTFFSRCSLDPVEKLFLLEDPIFKEALEAEARRLSMYIMKGKLSAAYLLQRIMTHINLCSEQKSNQRSLAALVIPRVETYIALLTVAQYNKIARVAKDNLSQPSVGNPPAPGPLGFKGESKPLKRYVVDGLLGFTFPPEFRNLLKAYFLLKGPFAGQRVEQIKDHTANFVAQGELVPTLIDMLKDVSREQMVNIRSGSLPVPPADMGIMWDLRRSPNKILSILRSNQCLDLYSIAEMAGFSRENAHLAFGLQSRALVDAINKDIHQLWDAETPALLLGIATGLRKQEAKLKAEWRGAEAMLVCLQAAEQPSGVRLPVEPPKVAQVHPVAALNDLGLFAQAPVVAHQPAAATDKSKADILREAAQARLAAKQALLVAKKRNDILAAAPIVDAEAEDERARMERA